MFERRGQQWFVEDVCAAEIAQRVGTPAYVYSSAHFSSRYRALVSALAGVNHRIFYSVKANSNLSVLRLFRELGAGFDIVSAGELERALAAGATPADFAAAVTHLLAQPDKQTHMIVQARQRLLTEFSWEDLGDKLAEFYAALLKRDG